MWQAKKSERIYDDPKSSQRIKEHNGNKYCCWVLLLLCILCFHPYQQILAAKLSSDFFFLCYMFSYFFFMTRDVFPDVLCCFLLLLIRDFLFLLCVFSLFFPFFCVILLFIHEHNWKQIYICI